jgi:hypothetical protein
LFHSFLKNKRRIKSDKKFFKESKVSKMKIYIALDGKNCYCINEKDDTLIFKTYDSSIEEYKYEDLLNYYKNPDITTTELDSKTGYIINRSHELLFIPLYDANNVLINYTFSELKNYDLLSKYSFRLSLDKR